MKKFVLALIVCLTFFVVACTTNVTLDVKTKTVTLKVDETYEITPELIGASKELIEYVVADPTILSIDGPKVTALKEGSTTVTLTVKGYDVTSVVSFTVEADNSVKGITISSENNLRTIRAEETLQLTAKVFPDAAVQTVVWSTTTPELVSVSESGLVTALKAGNAEIVATSTENAEVSQNFKLVIEEALEKVVNPESVKITAEATTCKVGEKINLSAAVSPAEANQAVEWESSDTTVATVARGVVTALKEGTVEITVTAKGFETVTDKIALTIEKSDDPIVSKDWDKMEYTTHAAYMEAENDTPLKVKGVVTHVNPTFDKDGMTAVTYIIQNGADGYYVYAQNLALCDIQVGKIVEIGGFKKYYRGLQEIVNVEYCKELAEEITYAANDLGEIDPTNLEACAPFHSSLVKGTAVFKKAEVNTEKAYSFYADVNGKETTFRVDPSYLTADEFASINQTLLTAVAGGGFEFTGLMTAFGYSASSTKPQILVLKSSDLVFKQLSNEELLDAASNNINVPSSIQFSVNDIKLQTSIEGFKDIVITWSSDNAAINVEDGAVTHGTEDVTVTLTAKLSFNGTELEKQYEVIVYAADNKEYQVLVTFDLEDALPAESYGNSASKASYAEGTVTLGTPQYTWLLRNTLIAAIENDRVDGTFAMRAQAGKTKEATARIEIQHDDEYNVVEFDAAIYGNDAVGTKVYVEYSLDSGATWIATDEISIDTRELTTYRVHLPEGVKRVAIVVVENSGKRVNFDNVKLMK